MHRGLMRYGRTALAAVLLPALLTGCTGPARTNHDYELKASNTAKAAVSEIRTAEIVVAAAELGRAPARYATTVLSNTDSALRSIQDTFASIQPPSAAADALRGQLMPTLSAAVNAADQTSFAARRMDDRSLAQASAPLEGLARKLQPFTETRS